MSASTNRSCLASPRWRSAAARLQSRWSPAASSLGMAGGPAAGVLAVGDRRLITPHGRVHLCEPTVQMAGRAVDLQHWSQHYQSQLEQLQHRLAEATGQPFEHIEADMQRRRYLDADEALAYGLVDEIAARPRV